MAAPSAISPYEMPRNDAMTKAVEPITGGISTAPVDEVASTAAAYVALNPQRFIAGIVTTPEVMTFEITLPLMEPCSPEERMHTCAGPPRTAPTSAKAMSLKNFPP